MKRTTILIIIEAAMLLLLLPVINLTDYLTTRSDSSSVEKVEDDFQIIRVNGNNSAIKTLTITSSNQSLLEEIEDRMYKGYVGVQNSSAFRDELPDYIKIRFDYGITEPVIKLYGEDWTTLSADLYDSDLRISLHPIEKTKENEVDDEDDIDHVSITERGVVVLMPAKNNLKSINILMPVKDSITLSELETNYLALSVPGRNIVTKIKDSSIVSLLAASNEYCNNQALYLDKSRIANLRVAPDMQEIEISSDSTSKLLNLQWPVSIAGPYTEPYQLDLSDLLCPVDVVVDSEVDLLVTERANLTRIKPNNNVADYEK